MSKSIVSEQICDNVKIVTYDDGSQHFELISKAQDEALQIKQKESESLWQKTISWIKRSNARICIKIRDLADPFGDRDDFDAGLDGKSAIEAGIKVKF